MIKRYASIDRLKCLLAFLVVCLHVPISNENISILITTIARIAVPCFFVISGFFSINEKNYIERKTIHIKKIKKLVSMVFFFTILYAVIFILRDYSKPDILSLCFRQYFSKNYILFNFGFGGHLWFVRALLYIEILMLIIERLKWKLDNVKIVITLWIADLAFCKYSNLLFGVTLPSVVRDPITKYIGVALMYFILGRVLKKNEENIKKRFNGVKRNYLLLCIIIASILNIFEMYVLERYELNVMPVNYIFTFVLSNLIMLYTIVSPHNNSDSSIATKVGNQHSANIYYFHPMILYFLEFIAIKVIPSYTEILVNPICVFLLSLVLSILLKSVVRIKNSN